ncbi:hypothetical protein ACFL0D_04130 [Thermoproteota archaeon]
MLDCIGTLEKKEDTRGKPVFTEEEIREKIKELKLIETETHKEINILELELRKMKIKEWEKILIKHG